MPHNSSSAAVQQCGIMGDKSAHLLSTITAATRNSKSAFTAPVRPPPAPPPLHPLPGTRDLLSIILHVQIPTAVRADHPPWPTPSTPTRSQHLRLPPPRRSPPLPPRRRCVHSLSHRAHSQPVTPRPLPRAHSQPVTPRAITACHTARLAGRRRARCRCWQHGQRQPR